MGLFGRGVTPSGRATHRAAPYVRPCVLKHKSVIAPPMAAAGVLAVGFSEAVQPGSVPVAGIPAMERPMTDWGF